MKRMILVFAAAAVSACALFDDAEVPAPYLVEIKRLEEARKCADACTEKDCAGDFKELRAARHDPEHPDRQNLAYERADLCECTCNTRCGQRCTNLVPASPGAP